MIKKLSKFGNSMALIIDKPIMQLLNIENDTELEIKVVKNSLVVSPIKKEKKTIISKDKKIQTAFEKITKKYDDALKKLALD